VIGIPLGSEPEFSESEPIEEMKNPQEERKESIMGSSVNLNLDDDVSPGLPFTRHALEQTRGRPLVSVRDSTTPLTVDVSEIQKIKQNNADV
jgi:hypothetical protein